MRTEPVGIFDIVICKLPYQEHPFVHGSRGGADFWLRTDGTWTTEENDPKCCIPSRAIAQLETRIAELEKELERYQDPNTLIVDGTTYQKLL